MVQVGGGVGQVWMYGEASGGHEIDEKLVKGISSCSHKSPNN